MKEFIFEYFRYTKSERNGIKVLMFLCLALIFYYQFQKYLLPVPQVNYQYKEAVFQDISDKNSIDDNIQYFEFDPNTVSKENLLLLGLNSKVVSTIIKFRNTGAKFKKPEDLLKVYGFNPSHLKKLKAYVKISSPKSTIGKQTKQAIKKELPQIEYFSFDPNTLDESGFLQLGISQKTIGTILKYRENVRFNSADDFSKIYGLKKEQFQDLEPYINIRAQEKVSKKVSPKASNDYSKPSKKLGIELDINTASIEEWQLIKGIGLTYAKRIVKFRDKLGGFHSIKQVGETYGINDSTFQEIVDQLKVNQLALEKIKINSIEVDELKKHPYLSWKEAKIIINYRKQHGAYKTKEDLKKVRILSEEKINRLSFYLDFQDYQKSL